MLVAFRRALKLELELDDYVVVRFPNERVLTDPGGVSDDILAVLRSDRV